MPLSEKVRIEVYLPDAPKVAYWTLLNELDLEFTHTFGGATTIRGMAGSYLSVAGLPIKDRVSLIYTDISASLTKNLAFVTQYAEKLKRAVFAALQEESVLVAVSRVCHVD